MAEQVAQAVQYLIDPRCHPIYIHCLDGRNVTGIVIAILRKLQLWNLSCIISEFNRFTDDHDILRCETKFIQSFNYDIKIPPTPSMWLFQGITVNSHPSVRLVFSSTSNRKIADHSSCENNDGIPDPAVNHSLHFCKSNETSLSDRNTTRTANEPILSMIRLISETDGDLSKTDRRGDDCPDIISFPGNNNEPLLRKATPALTVGNVSEIINPSEVRNINEKIASNNSATLVVDEDDYDYYDEDAHKHSYLEALALDGLTMEGGISKAEMDEIDFIVDDI